MPVTFADPEILRQQIGVSTQALAFNQDNTVNGPAHPALGPTSPGCSAGGPNVPVAANLAGVTVIANNGTAPVQYAGSAPILPCGITQINMQVPTNAPSGTYTIALQANSGSVTLLPGTNSTIVVK